MPSRHYKRNMYKNAIYVNPKITNFNLTMQSAVLPKEILSVTQPVVQEINRMLAISENPQKIIDFYDNSMKYIYDVLDMLIRGDDIDIIIHKMNCVKTYILENLTKYNIYSDKYSDTYFILDKVRELLFSIIDNMINNEGLNLIDRRLTYLKESLTSVRLEINNNS